MHLLYNSGILILGLAIRLSALFKQKSKEWVNGRRNFFTSLPNSLPENIVWFHCASLGEFDQGLPLMNRLKQEDPKIYLLVTFFSPSGFKNYSKREHKADFVCYLPLDTPGNARKFIDHFKPKKVFFVKYEFWSNYIFEAKRNNAKIYNISGIFRKNHRFFKWYGSYFRKTLRQFDYFFVQNDTSEKLLHSIGIINVKITGDSRFDRVLENKKKWQENEIIELFKKDEPLFIIGSSWPEDEKILAPWMNEHEGKIIIAPHNISEAHILSIEKQLSVRSARYSKFRQGDEIHCKVMILDTIGQLTNVYAYGNIAYIGGGFSGNLHNILEPAVFGLPVIFGPRYKRFPEASRFIQEGIGYSVHDTQSFIEAHLHILSDYEKISNDTTKFVEKNRGASSKILKKLKEIKA